METEVLLTGISSLLVLSKFVLMNLIPRFDKMIALQEGVQSWSNVSIVVFLQSGARLIDS